jgi:hypothetical protein
VRARERERRERRERKEEVEVRERERLLITWNFNLLRETTNAVGLHTNKYSRRGLESSKVTSLYIQFYRFFLK